MAALEIHKLLHQSRFEIRRKRKLAKVAAKQCTAQTLPEKCDQKSPPENSSQNPETQEKTRDSEDKIRAIAKIPSLPKLTSTKLIRSVNGNKQVSPLIRPLSEALSAVASISQESSTYI